MGSHARASIAELQTTRAEIIPYQPSHADAVRSLFVEINHELAPPGMERAFADYVERALTKEIGDVAGYYDRQGGNGFWVMLLNDSVIGMVGLERQTSEAVELRRMYLNKAFRGRGLADRLLDRAEAEARTLGYHLMVLSTAEIQLGALTFYRRAGFQEVRREAAQEPSHKIVGSGLERFFFEKKLTTVAHRRERIVRWDDPIALAKSVAMMSGYDFLQAVRDGNLPLPPICHLIGFRFEAIKDGLAIVALMPDEAQYNPIGSVHGGVIATVLDSVMGCAVHTKLAKGSGYTTLEIKVNYLRAVNRDTGPMRATGRVIHAGRRIAVAEGSLVDASGKRYAQSSTTCLVLELPQ